MRKVIIFILGLFLLSFYAQAIGEVITVDPDRTFLRFFETGAGDYRFNNGKWENSYFFGIWESDSTKPDSKGRFHPEIRANLFGKDEIQGIAYFRQLATAGELLGVKFTIIGLPAVVVSSPGTSLADSVQTQPASTQPVQVGSTTETAKVQRGVAEVKSDADAHVQEFLRQQPNIGCSTSTCKEIDNVWLRVSPLLSRLQSIYQGKIWDSGVWKVGVQEEKPTPRTAPESTTRVCTLPIDPNKVLRFNANVHTKDPSGHGVVRTNNILAAVDLNIGTNAEDAYNKAANGIIVSSPIAGKVVQIFSLGSTFGSCLISTDSGLPVVQSANAGILCHINPEVSVGQTLKAGQRVGIITAYQGDFGPHLHLELKINNKWIEGDGRKLTWENIQQVCSGQSNLGIESLTTAEQVRQYISSNLGAQYIEDIDYLSRLLSIERGDPNAKTCNPYWQKEMGAITQVVINRIGRYGSTIREVVATNNGVSWFGGNGNLNINDPSRGIDGFPTTKECVLSALRFMTCSGQEDIGAKAIGSRDSFTHRCALTREIPEWNQVNPIQVQPDQCAAHFSGSSTSPKECGQRKYKN